MMRRLVALVDSVHEWAGFVLVCVGIVAVWILDRLYALGQGDAEDSCD